MYCQNCKAPLPQGAVSCPTCGALIAQNSAPNSQNPPAPPQYNVPHQSSPQAPQPPVYAQNNSPAPQPSVNHTQGVNNAPPQPPTYSPQNSYTPPATPQPQQVSVQASAQTMQANTAAPAAAYAPQPIYAQPSMAQPVAQAFQPAPAGIALNENPLRAIVLAGILSGILFLAAAFPLSLDETSLYYIKMLFYAGLACSVYLIMKPDVMSRVCAGVIGVVISFAYSLSWAATLSFMSMRVYEPLALFTQSWSGGSYLFTFLSCLIISAFVIGAGSLSSILIKPETKNRVLFTALICGAALLIGGLFGSFIGSVSTSFGFILAKFFSDIINAVALGLAVFLVFMLCNMKSYNLETKIGHKIWFGLCLTFTTLSFVIVSVGSVVGTMFFSTTSFFMVILTMGAILGYAQLLMSKRIGFFAILLAAGILFFAPISYGTYYIFLNLFVSNNFYPQYFELIAGALPTLLNPAITSIVIYFIWKKVPADKPYVKPPVSMLFKIFAIAGVAIGVIVFVVGSVQYFNLFFLGGLKTPPAVSFLLGVFWGSITTGVGVYSLLACFRKQSRAPKALLITNIVTTVLAVFALLLLFVE